MSAKKTRRWNTRTILIVLLIVLIAVAVSLYILNLEEPPKYYEPEVLRDKPENFIGKTVTVEGYYHDEGFVTSQPALEEGSQALDVDYSDVNITLLDGREYRFTGKLEWVEETPYPKDVIFIAEKIKEK
jgi:cytochrome c-type biogenesis protein CcmE